MTNFEYWKDEILKISDGGYGFGVVNGTPVSCGSINCDNCDHNGAYCSANCTKWLYAEHVDKQPTLTKKERMFCELVETGYIARDEDGRIFYYKHMPVGHSGPYTGRYWSAAEPNMTLDIHIIDSLQNGFEFIKGIDMGVWDVEELLKLEVREEKDN